MQVMTDFFGRRPIEHMRNAFRNADVDDSGELDQLEFRQAIKAMKCGLGDKDADALFKLADQDGSGSIGIHEFFVNFRHDHWPRERFFWTKPEPNVNLAGNLTKKERVDLSDALAVQFDQPAQLSTPDIMKVLAEKVAVHGWCYGLKDGLLKDLQVTMQRPDEVVGVFRQALKRYPRGVATD